MILYNTNNKMLIYSEVTRSINVAKIYSVLDSVCVIVELLQTIYLHMKYLKEMSYILDFQELFWFLQESNIVHKGINCFRFIWKCMAVVDHDYQQEFKSIWRKKIYRDNFSCFLFFELSADEPSQKLFIFS